MVEPLDATDMDMIRRGDMLGPKLGAKTVAYIEDLKRDLYLLRNERANARDHVADAEAEVSRLTEALQATEAAMSIVEPRSNKAQYLDVLGTVRSALNHTDGDA